MAENKGNKDEFVNSQSSNVEEEDLQTLEADFVPENTKTTDLLGFEEVHSVTRDEKVRCDFHTVIPVELNEIL